MEGSAMNKVMEKVPVEKTERITPVHTGRHTFESLRDEVDRLFRGYGTDFWRMPEQFPVSGRVPFWVPMMAKESFRRSTWKKDHPYELMFDLPGLDEKEIEVKYDERDADDRGRKERGGR
jgi:HSP20 family molecular chaperone IbpA